MWYQVLRILILVIILLYPIHTSKSSELAQAIKPKDISMEIEVVNINETPLNYSDEEKIEKIETAATNIFYEPIIETDLKKLKVKKVKTTIKEEELKKILNETHIEVFNKPANENKIHMAWAQIAFENGRGEKVYNYNLGNIGGNPEKPIRHYYKVSGYRFRAFQNFKDGARCYWQVLKERCSGSLKFFDAGDPYTASLYLRRCGYYRADVGHYSKNLSALFFESYKKSIIK